MNASLSVRVIRILAIASLGITSAAFGESQFVLQKSNSVSLSALFAAGTGYGSNPLSVTVDSAGNAYVGGYNSSANIANIGIVSVNGILSNATTLTGLANTQFASPTSRGIDALASSGGDIFALHDSGSATTSFIERLTSTGSVVWQTANPGAGTRASALAIDPIGNAGNPAVAFLGFSQGRRATLDLATGVADYTFSGGAKPGAIINTSPALPNQTNWRALAFDSTGQIALGTESGFGIGARVNENQFSTLDGSQLNVTSRVTLKGTSLNNVGNGITFLKGAATDEMIAFSPRGSGNGSGIATQTLTDGLGGVQTVNTKYAQLRLIRGQNGYLTQTQLTGAEDGIGNEYTGEVKNFATGLDANGNPALYVVDYLTKQLDVYTIEPQYVADADGTWSTNSNWVGGFAPDSRTTNATFAGAITAPRTVTLDGARTVKQLKFNNANRYTINGTAAITLGTPTLNGDATLPAYISVVNGSHTVNAPIVLASNARFDVTNAVDTLKLGAVDGSGRGLTKRGAGKLEVGHIRVSTLALNEGATVVTANGAESGISRVASLQLGGGTIDLTNNGLIVDYAAADPTPYTDILNAMLAGTINSSLVDATKTLGIVERGASTVPAFSDPALIVDGSTVVIRFTLRGDTNLDKTVNFDDLLALAQNYGTTSGAQWIQGDTNYSGTVDFDDLLVLAQNYGGSLALAGDVLGNSMSSDFTADFALARSLVPEPTSLGLLGGIAAIGLRLRK